MKIQTLLTIIALSLLGSGCRLAHNAWLTTIAEPFQYPRNLDDKFSHKRFTGMAEVALDDAIASARAQMDDYACDPYSSDHQQGFIDGFVDYLEAGGLEGPPPLPPRHYWRGKYQNPFGHQCMQDWFEGYEHGVAIARASNFRSFVVVPTSDAVVAGTMQSVYGRLSASDDEPAEDDAGDANFVRATKTPPANSPRRLDVPAEVSRIQRANDVK